MKIAAFYFVRLSCGVVFFTYLCIITRHIKECNINGP